ncbi:MAG: phosphoribosylglycinamide formyltransferase [Gammaproteobacteria bacterium]|nr:phosphoribosylglycinamide formyltransferase [Gammaproteobacteria bacterium]
MKVKTSRPRCKIVVLISGSGTNLQALIDAANIQGAAYSIVAVISNKADAYGLVRAATAGITTRVVNHRAHTDRGAFDRALMGAIDHFGADLVLLSGFMRILTAQFVCHYRGKLINIHPSLLPKYQGLHTHQRALEAGDKSHGATVHFVTEELDGGPVIIQAKVPIRAGDTSEILARRVQRQEHYIYPLAATWFALGRVRMANEQAELDGKPLPPGGKLETLQ